MSKSQITLDLVVECTRNRQNRVCVQGAARDELTKRKITSRIDVEKGPTGWPVVTLIGSRVALTKYLTEVYDDDGFYADRIIPYQE
jgi:hypothetical protein